MKVLVVDDHQNVVEAITLCINIRWPTSQVVIAYDGETGLEMVKNESPDIIILDIGLPDIDGFSVLTELRKFSQTPVIMLTVRDTDVDIARSLKIGADDYIIKPFSHIEFLARVEAVLRRSAGHSDSKHIPLAAGDLWVDFDAGEVLLKGKLVQLTPTEMRILSHLMLNAGRVVTQDTLAIVIWGANMPGDVDTRTVKVHIQHMRSKLGDNADSSEYIGTVYGIGYKFTKQVNASSKP
ncbi:response regulator transcription factor [Chloroflexota bacterium]